MNNKTKYIIIGVIIGIITLPTLTFGSTFVSALIQGKTVEEAVQILAEQMDSLIGRIGVLETRQLEQERLVSCNYADSALVTAQLQGGIMSSEIKSFDDLISKINKQKNGEILEKGSETKTPLTQEYYQMWQSRLEKVLSLKQQYLTAKSQCENI